MRQSIDLLGGMGALVQPGQRVLLKPNLLRVAGPERATTTHPAVVASVARLVREAGGEPIIADSPGGPYSPALLRLPLSPDGDDLGRGDGRRDAQRERGQRTGALMRKETSSTAWTSSSPCWTPMCSSTCPSSRPMA